MGIQEPGQLQTNVGGEQSQAQECLEGIASVSLNIEDASIETSGDAEDDEIVFEGVCFYKPFIACG